MPDAPTAADLYERLERRVLGPEGQGHRAFLFSEIEVDGRRADGVSLDLWQSRGHLLQGYEIKVSRADWLHELNHPEKADGMVRRCDHFWLVTAPGVLKPGELPEQWGLLLWKGKRRHLVAEKEAPRLDRSAIATDLLVSMLRRVRNEGYDLAAKAREEERGRMEERGELDFEGERRRADRAEQDAEQLRRAFTTFKEHSQIDFLSWSPREEDLAIMGKLVHALRVPAARERLLRSVQHVESQAVDFRKAMKEARVAIEGIDS